MAKLIELQRETDKSTIIVADFNIPLSEMDRSRRQKISKDIAELNRTINQLDIIEIYRLLHPTMAESTFF
jgi:NAD(P)H-dependent FMN reductase